MAFQRSEVTSAGQIPELDGVIVARTNEDFPIRRDRETADPALVTGQGFFLDDGGHLEQLDGRIPTARDQKFRVRGKGHGADPVVHRFLESAVVFDEVAAGLGGVLLVWPPMAIMEDLFFAAWEHFPNLDLSDIGPAGEMDAVRRERDADRPVVVILIFPEQRHQLSPSGDFPDLDVFIMAAPCKHEAVRREGEATDVVIVARKEKLRRFAGLPIPESNRTVFTAGRERLPVRCEDDGADVMGMAAKGTEQPTGFDVPHAHEAFGAAAGQHGPIG